MYSGQGGTARKGSLMDNNSEIRSDVITRDKIISRYRDTRSIKRTAACVGLSESTVRRILLDASEYSCPTSLEIYRQIDCGHTPEQIAASMRITSKTVRAYLPYVRKSYAVDEKTENALKSASWRRRKKGVIE